MPTHFLLCVVDVPNAGDGLKRLAYKQEWSVALRDYMKQLDLKKPVILSGDLNVAHLQIGTLKYTCTNTATVTCCWLLQT